LEQIEIIFNFISHFLLVLTLGFYLALNLQWYSYKIERVLFKHHKVHYHLIYFAVPFVAYYLTNHFFWIFFYFVYLPVVFIWYKKIDKKLAFTWRIKRFFMLLIILTFVQNIVCHLKLNNITCEQYSLIMPLILTLIGSNIIEYILFMGYYRKAQKKLKSMPNLKIIGITASYGKTSMKNFLDEVLSEKYRVYSTPKSVNTLVGIIKDINESLPSDAEIYIVEAGARAKGDIKKISNLIQHQYGIVGKIGPQHIEYFKDLSNILKAKLELSESKKLKKLFVHESVYSHRIELMKKPFDVKFFGKNIKNINASLENTSFELEIGEKYTSFTTQVLGSFQSVNIYAVVLMAIELNMPIQTIQRKIAELSPTPHRLQKIRAGGKLIIDDGYNGNLDGMLEAFELVSKYEGRKVVITPGLVESDIEQNEKIAFAIDDIFDLVIITGALNRKLFQEKLINKNSIKIFLENKDELESVLASQTKANDVILFANDAPNFI
jgi:UDP-N-acetylmuramoyl-tripeptide--D-alanyl-D-alanine ligase